MKGLKRNVKKCLISCKFNCPLVNNLEVTLHHNKARDRTCKAS